MDVGWVSVPKQLPDPPGRAETAVSTQVAQGAQRLPGNVLHDQVLIRLGLAVQATGLFSMFLMEIPKALILMPLPSGRCVAA